MKLSKVMYSCGHTGIVELPADEKKRSSQIANLKTKVFCPDCWAKMLAEKDAKNSIGCQKIKMSDKKYREEYLDCAFTKVGVEELDCRYVFIPFEKAATLNILKILKIKKDNPNYKTYYQNVIENYLNKSTKNARVELKEKNLPKETQNVILAALNVIDKYQNIKRAQ